MPGTATGAQVQGSGLGLRVLEFGLREFKEGRQSLLACIMQKPSFRTFEVGDSLRFWKMKNPAKSDVPGEAAVEAA